MNFSLHLETTLAKELNDFVKRTGKTRNHFIQEAIRFFLSKNKKTKWPKSVYQFAKIEADIPSFESYRKELKAPKENPFS